MQWQDHFSIGVPLIDDQHKKLFQIADKLQSSHNTNAMYKEMGRSIVLLVDYTMQHFRTEEAFMKKIRFPKLETHQTEHRRIIKQLQEVLIKLKADKHVSPSELIEMTSNWIFDHTLQEDAQIKAHLDELKKEQHAQRQVEYEEFRANTVSQLQQVTNLVQKETIPQENYEAKKKALLDGLTQFEEKAPMDEVLARIDTIESMVKRQLIDEDEEQAYRIKIFENIDIDEVLAEKKKPKRQLSYLKSLYLKDLITEERYKRYCDRIEGRDCHKTDEADNSGSDKVCLL